MSIEIIINNYNQNQTIKQISLQTLDIEILFKL